MSRNNPLLPVGTLRRAGPAPFSPMAPIPRPAPAAERAAIAAVAVAIAHEATPKIHEFPLPATPIVSAWQAVQRGRQLSQHGPRQK